MLIITNGSDLLCNVCEQNPKGKYEMETNILVNEPKLLKYFSCVTVMNECNERNE